MRTSVVWEAMQWPSVEHVDISPADDGWVADGAATAVVDGQPTRLQYRLSVAGDGTVRALDVVENASGRSLKLRADGAGSWQDGAGTPIADLDGCVDVDISITPLTNTLPVRRLGLAVGESADIRVAYVDVPSLTVRPVSQRYTRVADATYRYQSGSFSADVTVDAAGIVVDYQGLWRRVGVPA